MTAALFGAFVAGFLMSLVAGYILAGLTRLGTKKPIPLFMAATIGALLIPLISMSRTELAPWIGAALAVAFFAWRYRSAIKPK